MLSHVFIKTIAKKNHITINQNLQIKIIRTRYKDSGVYPISGKLIALLSLIIYNYL